MMNISAEMYLTAELEPSMLSVLFELKISMLHIMKKYNRLNIFNPFKKEYGEEGI